MASSERTGPTAGAVVGGPGDGGAVPRWYRSQGALAVLAWIALALGCRSVIQQAGSLTVGREATLFAFLAVLPSAASAVVQLFHPQDILSLALGAAGLGQVLRQRWALAGALLGAAFLSKQHALLIWIPVVAVAPGGRERGRLLAGTGAVVAAGLLPFLLAAPAVTFDNLTGLSAGGAVAGATVISLLGATGNVASAVARDAPVLFAAALCWLAWRRGWAKPDAVPLVALVLACVASRLAFESVVFPYYLLAPSVIFFLLDSVWPRWPTRSLTWCAATAFFVAVHPGNRVVEALGTLVFAALAVAAGLAALAGSVESERRARVAIPRPGGAAR